MILAPGDDIDERDVAEALPAQGGNRGELGTPGRALKEIMSDLERRVLERALERHDWKMAAAARELQLERSHLYKKVKALGIERPR